MRALAEHLGVSVATVHRRICAREEGVTVPAPARRRRNKKDLTPPVQ
jgi:transposase